jgi:hypothetical protein
MRRLRLARVVMPDRKEYVIILFMFAEIACVQYSA